MCGADERKAAEALTRGLGVCVLVGRGVGVNVMVGTVVAVEVGNGVGGTLVFVATGWEVSVGGKVAGKTEVCVGKGIAGVCVATLIDELGKLQPARSKPNNKGKVINLN